MQTSVSGVLSHKQDIQGPPGKMWTDEQNCPLDMTGPPRQLGFPAEDLHRLRPSASLRGGERNISLTEAVASWLLLGDGESVFIKGLAPGRWTMLYRRAPHP